MNKYSVTVLRSTFYSRPHVVWEGCYVLRLRFIHYLFISAGDGSCWNLACWPEVDVMNADPNWLQTKFWGLEFEKKFERCYSSELITLEWKRISARLKLLCNRKKMAYKMYVRPRPLTSGCKQGECLYMYKCENFRFFCYFLKLRIRGCFRTGKPISATTRSILVKLSSNVA